MLRQKLIDLKELERKLISGGGEWHELVPPGMTRSTLQRYLRLLAELGLQITSTKPEGGSPDDRTRYFATKHSAYFRH